MRKFLSLAIAAVLSISTAFATTVYCKMTQSWWTADGAAVGVHYWGGTSAGTTWPGVRMTSVAGQEGMWSYDVPSDVTGLIFTRVNGSGTIADWAAKTGDLALPTDGKNLYTITSASAVWGDPGCTGEWSTYTAPASKVTYTALTKAPSTGNWAGQYLIVFDDNKAYATHSSKDLQPTSDALTIDEGEIEINSTDMYYVTVELMQGGYSIKLPSGKYLSTNASSNQVNSVASPYAFNFEYTASGVKIFGKDTKGDTRYVVKNGSNVRGYTSVGTYKLPTLYRTGDEAPALQTLYFVNTLDWAKVNAFVWPATGDAYKEWPGEAAVKTGEKALEKDIYSYTFPATYVNVIFNNGTAQTADLKWDKAKPYFVPGDADGEWYASTSEIPVPCQDGPYSLLVNGTDTIKSVKGDEFDGYTQYVVYASLTKNDKIQVLNESCGALWMPAIEEGGASAHFKKGENDATIDSTGCFDLYIKMKAGEDKVYIGYGICEGDSVAPCLDGPYSLLVNGTDTIKSVKGDEFDGYTQYVVYASLTKNDKIQVLNESCGALWMPAIEEGGASAHFKKGENDATIDSTGCFDLYIKMKSGEDKVYIGYGICEGDSVAPCLDGPYSLLVNGTDTIKSVKGDEFDGYTQYVVYASLTKNDKIQVLNESCGALWMPAIEEGGASAHFKKGENDATIDSTGCFDLYIKMKAGEDKVYIGYGICEGDSVAPCLDGPYSLLVNGTDTIKSVKGDEFDGYTQYVVYASLTKNDKIQVLNESCGALWMPAIEEGGASAHFKKGENDATIDSTGCFDLYIKMKAGEDKVYIGYGICEGDSVAPCLDGPYSLLVNGTDTIKSVKGDEFDGYTQYVVYASLTKNDKIQVLNESCGALWMPAIEEGGASAHFKKGENDATIDSTGCFDLYIKMKAGEDKVYIGYGICEGDSVAPCLDGPYSLLVNGTDTIKSVKGDEFDGYTQYVVYASLTKNDKIQVLNESCGALWMPAIEEGGASAHFKKGENDATIDSTGCFDLYIKMKAGEDKVYIGYGICEDDSVAPCLDGPYSLLVNGTDTIKSVKGDEFDGYTQYVVYASLTKNDKIQVLNESCGALWMPAIEEGGASAHFKKGENDATIDSTGCFDLYIKMKAGEDKVYIGYGICEGDSVAPCLDGPYSLLVNGTDTIKSVKGDEFDGYTQYVVYASLTKNDKIQVLNESCGALWMPAIEEGGASAHFKKGENDATIDSTGCFDLYIKMKAGEDKVYIGYGICEGDSVAPCLDGPYSLLVNGTDTIKSVKGDEFDGYTQYVVYASLTKNDKIQVLNESCGALWMPAIEEGGASAHFKKGENDATIDSTGCFDLYIKMKAGEDKVYIGYGICEGDSVAPCQDGPYGFIVNGTDTLKAVALEEADDQGRKQYLIDSVALKANDKFVVANLSCDSKWVMDVEEYGAYANFTKGEDAYTVKVDGMYAFYIKMSLEAGDIMYIGEIKDDPVTGDKFYMKNNWDAGADWTWKEMTKDGDNFKLENVVFGGSGVNYNTSETDEGAAWVEVADILGDKIAAKDTVTFVLNPTAKTVTATIVGKYIPTGDVQYFMKNNWNAGADWTWKEMTKDGNNYKLENVVYGGTGVNYNTEATDANATWVAEEDILGDKIAAKDTVTLTLDPVAATVTAKLIGKYQEGTEPENAYGLMINGTTFVRAELNPATANEYMALGVELTAGQTFQVFDKANNVGWVIANWNEGSYQFTIENDKYVVTETAKYDFYFKMEYGNDYIYVAKQGDDPQPGDKVYTIVGVAALVGADWDPEAKVNDMTKQADGSYKLVKENVVLEAKGYDYKVIEGHAWGGWELPTGGANQTLDITVAGTYNVTFTLDAALTTLTATATNVGPAPAQEYGLMINGTNFVKAELNPATANEYMALDVALTAGQTFQVFDKANNNGWVITNWNEGSYQFTIENDKYVVTETAKYDFYFKLDFGNDYIYVAKKETPSAIDNLMAPANEMRKVMIDGKLYILRDGKVYSVQGQLIR